MKDMMVAGHRTTTEESTNGGNDALHATKAVFRARTEAGSRFTQILEELHRRVEALFTLHRHGGRERELSELVFWASVQTRPNEAGEST